MNKAEISFRRGVGWAVIASLILSACAPAQPTVQASEGTSPRTSLVPETDDIDAKTVEAMATLAMDVTEIPAETSEVLVKTPVSVDTTAAQTAAVEPSPVPAETEIPDTETLTDGTLVVLNEQGLPKSISINGQETVLKHPGIWPMGDEVRWWNKQTERFEVLKHIEPGNLVYQDNWVTGMTPGMPVRIPVAVIDLASGELARGDFGVEAPKEILYNQAIKMNDDLWYRWEHKSQTWNQVTDEITQVILEAGEDPSDEYVEEQWADGMYLVKQDNGARLAKRGESGWELITDLKVKYGKYLDSVRSIDQLVFKTREFPIEQDGMFVRLALRNFRCVYVDNNTQGLWFEPSLGEYVGIYTVTMLVPVTPADWQTVEVIWGSNYPDPRVQLSEIIKVGGGIGGKTLTTDPERAWSLLHPGQVLDARVWIRVVGSNLNIHLQQLQDMATDYHDDIELLFNQLPETVGAEGVYELPANLVIPADDLSIPYGY